MTTTAPKKRQNLTKACDKEFSLLVRRAGMCAARGEVVACSADLQCAHGFSRRYRAVRWDRRNAFALCRAHHMLYTHNPILWDDWLRNQWGRPLYEEMRALALSGERPDLKELLVNLRAQAKEFA